jgi:hypothetical protein
MWDLSSDSWSRRWPRRLNGARPESQFATQGFEFAQCGGELGAEGIVFAAEGRVGVADVGGGDCGRAMEVVGHRIPNTSSAAAISSNTIRAITATHITRTSAERGGADGAGSATIDAAAPGNSSTVM